MLTPIEQKQLNRFETMMAMPKWKYIFLYGIIGWGLPVAIIVSLINIAFLHKTVRDLYINLSIFPLAGTFFGLYMRTFMPRQIKRLREKALLPDSE